MTTFPTSRWTRSRSALAVVGLLAVAGCGGDTAGPNTPVPASLRVIAGDQQTAAAGSPLAQTIVVEVTDGGGAPVPGVGVTFAVTAGGGAVSAKSATSDASGRATTQWTVGTKAGDAQQLSASVASSASVPTLTVTASVVAGAPAVLDATPSIAGRAGLALPPISVVLRDQYGNLSPAAGIRILPRLDPASTQTLVGASGVATDLSGAVVNGLSINGKAGAVTLVLDAEGMTSARVAVALAGGAPVRTQVFGSASIDASAGTAGPPIGATPIDAWDNAVAGVDVTFAVDGVGVIGHATSGSDGVAILSAWTAPALGSYRLTAAAAGATPAQYSLTVHHPPPATLTPSPSNPSAGQAGSAIVLDVKATDAAGNTVPDATLTWTSGAKQGSANTDNTGVAHVVVPLDTKVGTAQVVVHAGPIVSTTITVQIVPSFLVRVVGLDSLSAPAGTNITLKWLAVDSFGNAVPNQSLYAQVMPYVYTGEHISASPVTTGADGTLQVPVTLLPYAGIEFVDIYDSDDPHAFFRGETMIYRTAARGAVVAVPLPCSFQAGISIATMEYAAVFGPNGHPAVGIGVNFSVQTGNGYLLRDFNPPYTPTPTYIGTSDDNGLASVAWVLPPAAATYHMAVKGPPGYDGAPVWDYACRMS